MASEQQELELQLLVVEKKKRIRRIYPYTQSQNNPDPVLDSLPRFGPVYRKDPSLERIDKGKTWEHVLRRSPASEAITTEIYLSAMRRIEGEARETYAEGTVDRMTGSQFRWMMIKDGCLFLQMALFILGRSEQLDYPPEDEFFGKKHNSKEMKEWIKSMFIVGNQIPFVVLNELMKQSFFQQVISDEKWNKLPFDLSKRVLYEFLILSALEQPIDLIHALQLMVIGPREDDSDDDEIDFQAEKENDQNIDKDKVCPSATELKQQGMHLEICSSPIAVKQAYFYFKKPIQACRYLKIVQGIGSRGINYVSSIFSTGLFLPPLMADDDIEHLLGCLKKYEIAQPLDKPKKEFSSYLRFMSELIRKPEDANLLYSKGVIYGSRRYREKLPRIFKELAPKDSYNHKFHALTLKISDYDRPSWKNLRNLLSIISLLTAVQTVYTVLSYYKGK